MICKFKKVCECNKECKDLKCNEQKVRKNEPELVKHFEGRLLNLYLTKKELKNG